MSCKRLALTGLLICFIAAACLSLDAKPDPSRFFVLAALPRMTEKVQHAGGIDALALGIGPIKFPGYLDRPQVVTRTSQNRLSVAENDRWAEPLDENFARVLSQNLSTLLQTEILVAYPWERNRQPMYQVQVEVLRFEPNADQLVELWARWSIMDSAKKTISVKESHFIRPTKDKSTEVAVAALSAALGELSTEIADTIQALTAARR
jgi:uncharacterized protein